MPTTDPGRRRRRPDDQTDYEDPIDRYRAFDDQPQPKKKKKAVNPNANAAYSLGLASLIPCVGAFLSPIAIFFAFLGLAHARKHPDAGGRGRAKSGIWFGMLGCFINYGLPAIFFMLAYLARIR